MNAPYRKLLALPLAIFLMLPGFADEAMRVTRDLQYVDIPGANSRLLSLDIYAPSAGEGYPVLIFIHGGAWVLGDKRAVNDKPDVFTRAGYVFVSVNYRLAPDVTHPVYVQDIAKAVAWLHEQVARFGGDPQRMAVMGHSAGAHLAALVATDDRYLKAEDLDLSVIKGAIPIDGAGYDIPRMVAGGEIGAKVRYEYAFGKDESVWVDASPVTHVASGKHIPPFLLIHAGNRKASRLESELLAEKLRDAGVSADIFHAADKNHLTVNRGIGAENDETTKAILEFLKRVIPPAK